MQPMNEAPIDRRCGQDDYELEAVDETTSNEDSRSCRQKPEGITPICNKTHRGRQ